MVCLRYHAQFPSFTACLKRLHDCLHQKIQVKSLKCPSKMNLTFGWWLSHFLLWVKCLKSAVSFEGCRYSLYRSLCIGSRCFCPCSKKLTVRTKKKRRIEEISSEMNLTSEWRSSYCSLLYWRTWRAPVRLKVDNLIAHFASIAVFLFMTSSISLASCFVEGRKKRKVSFLNDLPK